MNAINAINTINSVGLPLTLLKPGYRTFLYLDTGILVYPERDNIILDIDNGPMDSTYRNDIIVLLKAGEHFGVFLLCLFLRSDQEKIKYHKDEDNRDEPRE